MSATLPKRMTADEFLAWAMQQPEGHHYELAAGVVVAMAPERAAHGIVKGNVFAGLRDAIRTAGLPCQTFVDSMAVRVDDTTIYEPDVVVRCGTPLQSDAIQILDPLIVVEVVSPSSRRRDTGAKLEDYFRISSTRHYMIVKTDHQAIIHHYRDEAGAITTRIIRDGTVTLDPPRIVLANVFADIPC